MKVSIVVIALMLIAVSTSTNLTLTITCEPCTVSCGFSKCFRLRGIGINTQVCSTQTSCAVNIGYSVLIGNATSDMVGTTCQSGLVIYLPSPMPECVDATKTCSPSYLYNAECSRCEKTPNCTMCEKIMLGGTNIGERCLGLSCGNVGTTHYNRSACTGGIDAFGNTCACCQTATSSNSTGGLNYCLETYQFLTNKDVLTWYNSYGNLKKHQWHLTKLFALILLMIVIIY